MGLVGKQTSVSPTRWAREQPYSYACDECRVELLTFWSFCVLYRLVVLPFAFSGHLSFVRGLWSLSVGRRSFVCGRLYFVVCLWPCTLERLPFRLLSLAVGPWSCVVCPWSFACCPCPLVCLSLVCCHPPRAPTYEKCCFGLCPPAFGRWPLAIGLWFVVVGLLRCLILLG